LAVGLIVAAKMAAP